MEAWRSFKTAQAELEKIRIGKLQAGQNKIAARWSIAANRCSKDFFEFYKTSNKKSCITELVDQGRFIREPKAIATFIQAFYRDLYTNDSVVEANVEARRICLLSVPTLVTKEMNRTLTRSVEQEELRQALRDIPSRKAPDHDSVPPEL